MFQLFKKGDRYEEENIFKSISEKVDSECKNISSNSYQICVCDRDTKRNIVKYCSLQNVFEWEVLVYLYIIDNRIALQTSIVADKIIYDTSDKVSLYTFLNKYNPNIKLLLNELFGFVCKFRTFNFLHGNLHIHNIFVNPKMFIRRGKFYIIDFGNSFILDKKINTFPNYNRSSFIGESDKKISSIFFEFWDFFTLFVSLKIYFKNNLDTVVYLETLITNYIPIDILLRFSKEYQDYCFDNILTFYLDEPCIINVI